MSEKETSSKELNFEIEDFDKKIVSKKSEVEKNTFQNYNGSKKVRISEVGSKKGYHVAYAELSKPEHLEDIDLISTINSAILNQNRYALLESDYKVKIRKNRIPKLSVILLDLSGSMGISKRVGIAKGIVDKYTDDSYVKREYLSVVTFRGREALVLSPFTKKYSLIKAQLNSLKTGGKTPLSAALKTALKVFKQFKDKNKKCTVEFILISDGKANVPLKENIKYEIEELSKAIQKRKISFKIYDIRNKSIIDPSISYLDKISEITNAEVETI
ncbi:von Willebrand factor type A [Methanococcus vannielii SB]|uniref:von Willebrand factor type A n=1 Tax=Methanococcus vannielii (strain ATCC 35089 / DSM 1224 / JCM 13029 / OCM 148 / SB) TaxID=406327 RepID=A6UNG4_METVS|nr:VWA domain-containing protein [Methanococcus vannielii]ABR54036.1 von Willebrand factor type A [Methanococcus vannielii SB]